jgi:ribosomal protein S18 acetylase RimI-like enzyme
MPSSNESLASVSSSWATAVPEPLPTRALAFNAYGMYGTPPVLSPGYLALALPEHPVFELRYHIARPLRGASLPPLRRVSALLINTRTKSVAGYLKLYLLGPVPLTTHPSELPGLVFEECADLGYALEVLVSSHLRPSELLPVGLQQARLAHLATLEIGWRYRGRGLGGAAVRALMARMQDTHQVGLLTYRPYPLQFSAERAKGCQFSHDLKAVAIYQDFLRATAVLSRHYAKQWGGHRLFQSDYFVASVGRSFDLMFNPGQGQWALLPGLK